MKIKKPVMRRCISCKEIYNRDNLLKITKDHNLGVIINDGMGRSAYICKSERCTQDSKIKKKLQRALRSKIDENFLEIIEVEIKNYK